MLLIPLCCLSYLDRLSRRRKKIFCDKNPKASEVAHRIQWRTVFLHFVLVNISSHTYCKFEETHYGRLAYRYPLHKWNSVSLGVTWSPVEISIFNGVTSFPPFIMNWCLCSGIRPFPNPTAARFSDETLENLAAGYRICSSYYWYFKHIR